MALGPVGLPFGAEGGVMTAFLEVWRPAGADLVPLGGDRITVGTTVMVFRQDA